MRQFLKNPVRSPQRTPRRAFGLVELLVVVAILAILAALLVPAVQRVRIAAARTQCINNLKMIALASHNYHDVNGRFPPGYCTNTGAGVLMYLLPYIDETPTYQMLPEKLKGGQGGSWLKQTGGLGPNNPANSLLRPFICPSANNVASVRGTVAAENLAFTPAAGATPAKVTFAFTANKGDTTLGLTNYVGNAGMYAFEKLPGKKTFSNGPLFPDSKTRITEITDGTSNTLFFGEALGGSESGPPTYGLTWMGTGVLPSYWDCQTPATWFTFGSNHPGVVNFAFCDGSVRAMPKVAATDKSSIPPPDPPAAANTPRWTAFQLLAGMTDNTAADLKELGIGE